MKCPECGSELIFIKTEEHSVHYGRLDCPTCKKFIKWVKSPKNEGIRTSTSKYNINNIIKFHHFSGEPFCFLCLRTKNQLGEKETLTRDHIIEVSKGGKDILENLQILCSACHKLKNWSRLYINWHSTKKEGEDE